MREPTRGIRLVVALALLGTFVASRAATQPVRAENAPNQFVTVDET